jgi:hypothetical protein
VAALEKIRYEQRQLAILSGNTESPQKGLRLLASGLGLRRAATTWMPRCTAGRACTVSNQRDRCSASSMPWFFQLRSHGQTAMFAIE